MRLLLAFGKMILVTFPIVLWAANPFTPPEEIQLFYQIIYPDESQTPLEYKMYVQNGSKMIALLNTSFVSKGDTFEGMKILDVNQRRVLLLSPDGEKRVVVIDAMQSKLQQLREMMNQENDASGKEGNK